MLCVYPRLLLAQPLPCGGGYTWTLASLLGEMLHLAEEQFGPRNASYTVLGIEFTEGIPQCWFPGNRGHVVVQLSSASLREPDRACFQLAHEAVHLLSPAVRGEGTVLAEGLAFHFQSWYMAHHYPADWPRSGTDWNASECASYARARQAVDELLALDPQAIRRLRAAEPTFSRITAQQIVTVCPSLPHETAATLAARFVR